MSAVLDPRVATLAADLRELERRKAERPIDFYQPLPHQRAFHEAPSKERWFVAGNRSGKTVAGAAEVVSLVTGRAPWWTGKPGEVWCGAVSLQDSEAIQRRAIRALLPPAEIESWPNERNPGAESMLSLRNGWRVRFKAHSQGRERWQGGSCALVWFDEEPDPGVYDEGFTRTVDCRGRVIVTFTPLNGLRWEDAYRRVYAPWLEFRNAHPGRSHGEVSPGVYVVTAAMSANPHVPADEVDGLRAKYAHRPLLLRVRIDGEWLDTTDEAIIPVDKLREHGYTLASPPQGGWRRVSAWCDSAFSASATSDRWCVSLAAADYQGNLYLLAQDFGRLDADERVRRTVAFLRDADMPTCYVQRTTPDGEFAHRVNDALMAAGLRAAVTTWPPAGRGAVPGKVERANALAVSVGNGQVYIRREHSEFRREAATFPHAQHDDVLDAGMGALMVLVESPAPAMYGAAVSQSGAVVRRDKSEDAPRASESSSWLWGGGRDLLREVD